MNTRDDAIARLLAFQSANEELNDRTAKAHDRHRSPPKRDTTDDSQWQNRRAKMIQDYKSFAQSDLKAADERKQRPKHNPPAQTTAIAPKQRPSPPREPVSRPKPQPHRPFDYDEAVQTQPVRTTEKSAECLLEQYPPDDLRYAKMMGNWEHTNPYVWADMLFHRKRMQMEQELAENRARWTQQHYPPYQPQVTQQKTPPLDKRETPVYSETPPQDESNRESSHQGERSEGGEPQYYRTVPGHVQIRADIAKMEYDMDAETVKMERILAGLRESAERSSKEHRESLKEFEMLKEDMKLKALDSEIRYRTMQSVLDEPFYYVPPTEFSIDIQQLTAPLSLPSYEPQLLSSESMFVHSTYQGSLDVYADYPLDEGLYDTRRAQLDEMRKPYDHRLEVSRGEDVAIYGKSKMDFTGVEDSRPIEAVPEGELPVIPEGGDYVGRDDREERLE